MAAKQILRDRKILTKEIVVERAVYLLPEATAERPHRIKYRLHCGGRDGVCLVRYDNETGKGDHRHYGGLEEEYTFVSLERLLQDFAADVERLTGGEK